MAAVQMNVRIDEETKARGDEVFARAGLTSSQVVRAVWEYAERTGEVPAFMRDSEVDADEAERRRKMSLVEQGPHVWKRVFLDRGLSVPEARAITRDDLSEERSSDKPKEELDENELRLAYYDDLRIEAYEEKRAERGMA